MNKRIHVVEDDEDIRFIIDFILRDANFDVELSASATDFYEKINYSNPDLILLDIMLPDGDGREICKKLKADASTKNIPIIMMSAHVAENDAIVVCNADDFITKPFDIDSFIHKITRLVKTK